MLPIAPLMEKYDIDFIFKPKFDFSKEGNVYEFNINMFDIDKEFGILYKLPRGDDMDNYMGCLTRDAKYKLEFFDGKKLLKATIIDKSRPTEQLYPWSGGYSNRHYSPMAHVRTISDLSSYKIRLTVIKPASVFKVLPKDSKIYFYMTKKAAFMMKNLQDDGAPTSVTEEEVKEIDEICFYSQVLFGVEANETLTNLRRYIENDDLEKVKEIISNGTSVNIQMSYGHTPLMFAAFHNSTKTMKYLLDNGADTEAKNAVDNRAILYAFGKKNTEAIKMLLEYNATLKENDKVYPFVSGGRGVKPFGKSFQLIEFLKKTVYSDGIEIYLKHGLDVNYIECDDDSGRFCHTLADLVKWYSYSKEEKIEIQRIMKLFEEYNAKTYKELINNQTSQGE
jgi:hypothetical protein